jgi:hypothetical protein
VATNSSNCGKPDTARNDVRQVGNDLLRIISLPEKVAINRGRDETPVE